MRDAFEANFAKGLEIGASFSAYHHGEKVVDLWGGIADVRHRAAWDEDTIALVFSTTKGATAICANKLAQEGRSTSTHRSRAYWPEFAAGGKDDPGLVSPVPPAGLAWIDGEMTLERSAVVGPGRRRTRATGSALGARIAARLSRHDVRMARR